MTKLEHEERQISDLRFYPTNARKHSKEQIEQVACSITEFGFLNPVLIDQNSEIIAGHCRVLAAKKLGMKSVPTLTISHLNDAQVRAYRLADNKLVENSTWNEELLRLELLELATDDITFDIEVTGFSTTEIDLFLGEWEQVGEQEPPIPCVSAESSIRSGDLFQVGHHRAICGDFRDQGVLAKLMDGKLADAVISDPPYNVRIKGHVVSGKTEHSEFAMASGEMSSDDFTAFLSQCMANFVSVTREGSVHFIFMDWRHVKEMLEASGKHYQQILNLCVWAKTNSGMGSFYRSAHELVFVFRKGAKSHRNNVQLGKHGRNRTNVWTYAGMNSFGSDRDRALAMHPTVKPTKLIEDAILDVTKRGDIVLDGFLGSGTTLIAAEGIGRVCYGCEIDPKYLELSLKRFQQLFGEPVIHLETGLTFEELLASRPNKETHCVKA